MFGINGLEFVALAIIAVLVIGPERLPEYASQLGRLVKELRRMATGARQQLRDEVGSEFDDVDWQKLDPRQYDPRRIIREALLEDDEPVKPQSPRPNSQTGSSGSNTGSGSGASSGTNAGFSAGAAAAAAGAAGAASANSNSEPAGSETVEPADAEPSTDSTTPAPEQQWSMRRRPVQELPAGEPAPFDIDAT